MKKLVTFTATALFLSVATAQAGPVDLGSAASFGVLAATTVTNTGPSMIVGNVGVSPGTAITGFPPGTVTGGTIYGGGAVPMQAQADLTAAYNQAAGAGGAQSLTGQDLGGLTLTPGVYSFASSAEITGTLTLDAQGDPNAAFIFQIGSTLVTASSANVSFINGGQGDDVFWQVGSSATLGTGTQFAGNILALTSITLTTGADITCGRALARNGAVTLDTNDVSINSTGCGGTASNPVAEPTTAALLGSGLFAVVLFRRKSRLGVVRGDTQHAA